MSRDRQFEIIDLPDDVRTLVAECEVMGQRALFNRNGRPVAILTSYDEYLALRETVEIVKDGALLAKITAADEHVTKGGMVLVEELLEK